MASQPRQPRLDNQLASGQPDLVRAGDQAPHSLVKSQTSARLLGGGEEGGQDEVPDRRAAGVVVEHLRVGVPVAMHGEPGDGLVDEAGGGGRVGHRAQLSRGDPAAQVIGEPVQQGAA
jgi:hypothetical protein